MAESSSDREPLEELAESFLERFRAGERPALAEFTAAHPELADQIRELFPALIEMEQAGSAGTPATGAAAPGDGAGGTLLESLGDYRIIREVGRGGMGVVYEAVQESLGRHVALKVFAPWARADPRQIERFRREARAAARLHHTNIVPVFGVGECNGRRYYAMQFIQGQGLDAILHELRRLRSAPEADGTGLAAPASTRSAPLAATVAHCLLTGRFEATQETEPGFEVSPSTMTASRGGAEPASDASDWASQAGGSYARTIARVGFQVAEALAHAHGHGILHRDIKPSNLLLDVAGNIWVTDFGLAKAEDSEALTEAGDIVGTLRYMAPERFHGDSGPASDIYGLGVTLYELLTLRPAFDEGDRARLIDHILHTDPPPPRALDTKIPRDLETVVLKAMAKHPADRYVSARALAEDLERFLQDRTILARRSTVSERLWRWCKRNPLVASLLGLLALVLGGVAIGSSLAAFQFNEMAVTERRAKIAESAALVIAKRSAEEATDKAAALQKQLYINLVARAHSEWQTSSVNDAERLLDECPPTLRGMEWNYVKRLCHPELWTYSGHKENIWCVAISPDGSKVASGSGMWVYSFEAGRGRFAVCDRATGRELFAKSGLQGGVHGVAFSPDSRWVATATGLLASRHEGELTLWEAASGRRIWSRIENDTQMVCVQFTPDGSRIVVGTGGFNRPEEDAHPSCMIWNAATGEKLKRIVARNGGVPAIDITRDGRRLAMAYYGGADVVDLASGALVRRFGDYSGLVYAVAFSPDGTKLAIGGAFSPTRVWDLETGRLVMKVTTDGTYGLAYSPDGKLLAVPSANSIRFYDIQTYDETGAIRGSATRTPFGFSPDGKQIVRGVDGTVALFEVAPKSPMVLRHEHGGTPAPPFPWVMGAAFHPNGRLVATACRDNVLRLWDDKGRLLRSWEGLNPRNRFWEDVFWCVAIHPNGKQLAAGYGQGRILRYSLETGAELAPLVIPGGKTAFAVAFSPDGRLLAAGSGGKIGLWDCASGKSLRLIDAYQEGELVTSLAFSPDGRRLVSGGGGLEWETRPGSISIFEPSTGRTVFTHPVLHDGVRGVAYSPDGRQLAAVNSDGSLILWDASYGTEQMRIKAHAPRATSLTYTPDGSRLITGGSEAIKFWDSSDWLEVQSLPFRSPACVAIGDQGRKLVIGSFHHEATLLDATPPPTETMKGPGH
jgi:WD40 repeat protein/serine/threonine protein kinase